MYKLLAKTNFLRFAQFASGIALVSPVVTHPAARSDAYGISKMRK